MRAGGAFLPPSLLDGKLSPAGVPGPTGPSRFTLGHVCEGAWAAGLALVPPPPTDLVSRTLTHDPSAPSGAAAPQRWPGAEQVRASKQVPTCQRLWNFEVLGWSLENRNGALTTSRNRAPTTRVQVQVRCHGVRKTWSFLPSATL